MLFGCNHRQRKSMILHSGQLCLFFLVSFPVRFAFLILLCLSAIATSKANCRGPDQEGNSFTIQQGGFLAKEYNSIGHV